MPDDSGDGPEARFLDRCARAEAAAHKRKTRADRPREGWRIRDFSGPKQVWIHGDEFSGKDRQEMVVGQPTRGLWWYGVDVDGKRIAEGWAGFLGVAMAAAETGGTLAGMVPKGTA